MPSLILEIYKNRQQRLTQTQPQLCKYKSQTYYNFFVLTLQVSLPLYFLCNFQHHLCSTYDLCSFEFFSCLLKCHPEPICFSSLAYPAFFFSTTYLVTKDLINSGYIVFTHCFVSLCSLCVLLGEALGDKSFYQNPLIGKRLCCAGEIQNWQNIAFYTGYTFTRKRQRCKH